MPIHIEDTKALKGNEFFELSMQNDPEHRASNYQLYKESFSWKVINPQDRAPILPNDTASFFDEGSTQRRYHNPKEAQIYEDNQAYLRFMNANFQEPKSSKRSQSKKNEQELLDVYGSDTTDESPMKF